MSTLFAQLGKKDVAGSCLVVASFILTLPPFGFEGMEIVVAT